MPETEGPTGSLRRFKTLHLDFHIATISFQRLSEALQVFEIKGYEILEPSVENPKNARWTQPIPDADPFNKPVSDPSKEKRAKLRAKRKKRN
jgi:hypothetical protein